MAKDNALWIQLTPTEANALMMLMEGEMESRFRYEGLDLKEWETLDLEGHKILAFHKYKKWYMENCNDVA